MMLGPAATQRLDERRVFLPCVALREVRESLRIGLAVDERLEHRAPALADDARQHAVELYVRVLEHLLDAQRVLRHLAHQLLSGPGEVTQFLDRGRGYDTA